ncbi:hypothetical protein [Sandaracinus amylolyticus]|uniref:hypothetical protein n=1 Tax=Sandaracinus amylolyticus TaxID=927083 RepID=UPI001F30CB52|nr:hypothetical protein [Sandaracinus amylolyticus]UJR81873.1 Hypothetical protein I5071_39380 [Sandaracinus amylolyticus]
MSEPSVYRILEGEPGDALVRRRIVAWRRLEPGDVRSQGSIDVPESPFLEAKVFEIALPAPVHADMKRLSEAKASALALSKIPLVDYEPAGVLISAAGGMAIGVWLEYLRPASWFLPIAAVCFVVGVVIAVIAKRRRAVAEAEAEARWTSAPERKEHDALAREIAQAWLQLGQLLKRDTGFHTEIRVAEGSNDPLRLASIDPRPMEGAKGFDPEDWLPTEGGGVRYEALHAGGEIATRAMPGTTEVGGDGIPPTKSDVAPKSETAAEDETIDERADEAPSSIDRSA